LGVHRGCLSELIRCGDSWGSNKLGNIVTSADALFQFHPEEKPPDTPPGMIL
jgi:hypothetical protein